MSPFATWLVAVASYAFCEFVFLGGDARDFVRASIFTGAGMAIYWHFHGRKDPA